MDAHGQRAIRQSIINSELRVKITKKILIQFSGIFAVIECQNKAVTECQNKAACKVEMDNLEVESSSNHFSPQQNLGLAVKK